jgi:hypothetical protein
MSAVYDLLGLAVLFKGQHDLHNIGVPRIGRLGGVKAKRLPAREGVPDQRSFQLCRVSVLVLRVTTISVKARRVLRAESGNRWIRPHRAHVLPALYEEHKRGQLLRR